MEPWMSKIAAQLRLSLMSDGLYMKQWFQHESVRYCFPMQSDPEIDDAIARWIGFSRYQCSLTAMIDGQPVGIATLFLQPYERIMHQCEFGMIVSEKVRGQGIGSALLKELMKLAKESFSIELLHLQVYEKNPAIRLYRQLGFREFGRQSHWIKEKDGRYQARIFMECYLSELEKN